MPMADQETPPKRPLHKSDALMRHENEYITIITHGNNVFATNHTGSYIWERLDGIYSIEEIVRDISATYQVDQSAANRRVRDFIQCLEDRGLLE